METIIAILVGAIVGPILTALMKQVSWVNEELGGAINLGLTVGIYLGVWAWVTGGDKTLLEQWLTWALAAAGVGSAGNNFWRKKMSYEARVGERYGRRP